MAQWVLVRFAVEEVLTHLIHWFALFISCPLLTKWYQQKSECLNTSVKVTTLETNKQLTELRGWDLSGIYYHAASFDLHAMKGMDSSNEQEGMLSNWARIGGGTAA
jgi:hypothetical protein